jgi:hypothetical protein
VTATEALPAYTGELLLVFILPVQALAAQPLATASTYTDVALLVGVAVAVAVGALVGVAVGWLEP